MQSSSEQSLVGEERYVTTLITAAKETTFFYARLNFFFFLREDVGFLIFGGKAGGNGVSVEIFSSTASPGTQSFNSR